MYSPADFTLTHTLANNVPPTALLFIQIPPQFEISSRTALVESCTAVTNLMDTLVCELSDVVKQIDGEDETWH